MAAFRRYTIIFMMVYLRKKNTQNKKTATFLQLVLLSSYGVLPSACLDPIVGLHPAQTNTLPKVTAEITALLFFFSNCCN